MTESRNLKEILLVDDDLDYSEVTRTRLESAGYHVSAVFNGLEALELLEQDYCPSLIIMDIDMPDRNGLTTLISLNARRDRTGLHIPVVVATGIESDRVRELVMEQKVNGYLKKPYQSEELLATVKNLIG
ncbi:MAG: response regulator transcription factor [Candidatus Omnitrophica bacterium]|nr:response regulator transcription factor [Candidatus Omnitrophota bacterium]